MPRLSRPSSRSRRRDAAPELREEVLELAKGHPRFGFRRIQVKLPGINIKAVHRIWKEEGLKLNRRKRRRLRVAKAARIDLTAPNQAWSMDFVSERLENGRQVRILAVLNCFTRECPLLKAASHYPSVSVQREREWLFLVRGKPNRIVSDNGPEFRALELPEGVEAALIQPGSPWQNGRVESFFDKLRDELVNRELIASGTELQTGLDEHQDNYNHLRDAPKFAGTRSRKLPIAAFNSNPRGGNPNTLRW